MGGSQEKQSGRYPRVALEQPWRHEMGGAHKGEVIDLAAPILATTAKVKTDRVSCRKRKPVFIQSCSTVPINRHGRTSGDIGILCWSIENAGRVEEVAKTSLPPRQKPLRSPVEKYEPPPFGRAIWTYFGYAILIMWGYVSDFLRYVGLKKDGAVLTEDVSIILKCALIRMFTFKKVFYIECSVTCCFCNNHYKLCIL